MRFKKRGQSLVEFALILPVLLLVFFAIIDGAFVIQGKLTVNHVARQTARFATTYQPPQGECFEHVVNGMVDNSYPWCGSNNESDSDYYKRRTQLIKEYARETALGLRIAVDCTGSTDIDTCLTQDEPGLFGTRVLGFMTFEAAELENATLENNTPGLPGLPVQVQVVHHVPLVIFSTFLPDPYLRVVGTSEMVNEGVQAGIGAEPPPVGGPSDPPSPPEDPPPPDESPEPGESPSPSPSPSPGSVTIELNFETALNMLPDERPHQVIATVTQDGAPIAGYSVEFTTDSGSFDPSGSEIFQTKVVNTDAMGQAKVVIYANEPMVATITAWVDSNFDGLKQTLEVDTAVKTWQATGPYLVVSDHYPAPEDVIGVGLHDHEPAENPYALWWCTNAQEPATVPIEMELANGVLVDDVTWFFEVTDIVVPENAAGTYHIESHSGPGGCGDADLIARSSVIQIKEVLPDLIVTSAQVASPVTTLVPGDMFTVNVEVANLQPVSVTTGPFDIDVYPHLEEAPYLMQLSSEKQWLETLGPGATAVLTFVVEVQEVGTNQLWVQVDTTNYVEEEDETNNVLGPVEFEICVGSDDFDEGVQSFWSVGEFGDADGSYWVNGDGALVMDYRASSGLWSYTNHNFAYLYQNYPGDFDARLQIFSEPTGSQWAKIGLHVREGAARRARFVHNMATHALADAGLQIGYENNDPGSGGDGRLIDDRAMPLPYWTRIVRTGQTYQFYTSLAAEPGASDWNFEAELTKNIALPVVGIAHANYDNWPTTSGVVDNFVICPGVFDETGGASGDSTPPPGFIQCEELLHVRSFEGNRDTVFEYWRAGEAGAYRQTSVQRYLGNFSIRMHASLGTYPCEQSNYDPYLYQEIEIPTDVYSISTLLVKGHYYVEPSSLSCSIGGSDPSDQLSLELQGLDGSAVAPAQQVVNGGVVTQTWHTVSITASEGLLLTDYAGQTLRLYWDAHHNEDYNGTFFYVDDVSAQVCTQWPIPDAEADTVSFGGLLTTQASGSSIRTPLVGGDVWAYTQSGETYHTVSIHDGTYHFYNLELAGTYVIYAEALVEGELRTAVASITLAPNERNYDVNLFLQ